MTAGDVKEDADGGEADDEARAAIGDERQRDSRQRRKPHYRGKVDRRLAANEDRQTRCEGLPERIPAAQRDPQADVGEGDVRSDQSRRADETELLADDGEDHVGVRLRQVVRLHDALAEADAERPTGTEPDDRLDALVS